MKKRVVVIGAGLCGSVLSALLRNHFQVTVVEQGRKKRPLLNEVVCAEGEINTSINRAEGLGGTTNYWHNALIELSDSDLQHAGIPPALFQRYYSLAWSLFLSDAERRECDKLREANRSAIHHGSCTLAHMVVPYNRANAWTLADSRYPGDPVDVVYGSAAQIVPEQNGTAGSVSVRTEHGTTQLQADYFLVCAGGLSTPVLLARSIGAEHNREQSTEDSFNWGYHDHPMAYVAKVQLRSDSVLKTVSCYSTAAMDVRSGFVYESSGVKSAFYLRPALNLSLKSITGGARYILSDLRNDPLSVQKIWQLFTNLDAVKEAILFKMKAGFRGDYYSVLILGEQNALPSRGIAVRPGQLPSLNWHITNDENAAYRCNFDRFLTDFAADVVARNIIPPDQWEFRTAAHHSGSACRFVGRSEDMGLPFFAVKDLPNAFVCDASLLRAGGIANSGLTLVALSHRLAELMTATL